MENDRIYERGLRQWWNTCFGNENINLKNGNWTDIHIQRLKRKIVNKCYKGCFIFIIALDFRLKNGSTVLVIFVIHYHSEQKTICCFKFCIHGAFFSIEDCMISVKTHYKSWEWYAEIVRKHRTIFEVTVKGLDHVDKGNCPRLRTEDDIHMSPRRKANQLCCKKTHKRFSPHFLNIYIHFKHFLPFYINSV